MTRFILTPRTLTTGQGSTALNSQRWEPFERLETLLFLVLIATLSLEWISLGQFGSTDLKWFHVAAAAFVLTHFLRFRPRSRAIPVLSRYRWFYIAWAFWIAAALLLGLLHRPFTAPTELARELLYGSVSVIVAAYVLGADKPHVRRTLRWAAVTTLGTLSAVLGVTFAVRKVNVGDLLSTAIERADPTVITYQLLRASFRSQELTEVGANLRHKVFAPLLIGIVITLLAHRSPGVRGARAADRIVVAGVVLSALFAVASLSRALTLCVVLAFGFLGLRILLRGRAARSQIAALIAGLILVAGIAVSPAGPLFWNRYFDETGSYTGRIQALSEAFGPVDAESIALGTDAGQIEKSPHNTVVRSWLSAGILGLIATVIYVMGFAAHAGRALVGALTGRGIWALGFSRFWVGMVSILPVLRLFTAGAGWHLNEWVCVGLLFGLLLANERAIEESNRPDLPAGDRALAGR